MDNKKKKQPKIAVIGLKGLPATGGAATVGEALINELSSKYEFTVYSISTHASEKNVNGIRQVIFKKTPIKKLNTFYYYIMSLMHVLFVNNYDLIHLHHVSSGYITPFLRFKYKVITTFHGIYRKNQKDDKFSSFVNSFIKFSQNLNLKYSNSIVSVSKSDQNYLNTRGEYKVNYIPNAINLIDFDRSKQNGSICFAAGRIIPLKGLDLVINALKSSNLNLKLIVIGDLNHSSEYKNQLINYSKGMNIEFVNLIKSKKELFSKISESDMFVFPSYTEAMSMMLLEVASIKVPIIASDIEANKNVFNDEEVLFFKSGDDKDLQDKIENLINNKDQRFQYRQNAFNKVNNFYKWGNVANQYEVEYNKLLKE